MEKTPDYPIRYNDRKFKIVNKFDCKSLDFDNFFTSMAISDKKYRKFNPTKAKVIINTKGKWTRFNIIDDHNSLNIVKLHNSLKKEIAIAKKAAKDNNLLVKY